MTKLTNVSNSKTRNTTKVHAQHTPNTGKPTNRQKSEINQYKIIQSSNIYTYIYPLYIYKPYNTYNIFYIHKLHNTYTYIYILNIITNILINNNRESLQQKGRINYRYITEFNPTHCSLVGYVHVL